MAFREHLASVLGSFRTSQSSNRAPFAHPDLWSRRRSGASRQVGVLVYTGVTTAELIEPVDRLADGLDADVVHIGVDMSSVVGIEPVRTVHVDLTPHDSAASESDVLVIPGGLGWQRLVDDLTLMTWLAHASHGAQGVLAMSTGSLLLASAGRLQGHQATGHWLARDELAALGADVRTERTAQSADHRIVTTTGASSAIAAATALAERVRWGPL